MKDVKIFLSFFGGMLLCALLINSWSCTREDAVVGQIEPPDFPYLQEVVKMSEGWTFDKAHSNVMWETPYRGVGALLTGRFNTFSTTVEFDADKPENSTISGFVVLSSVNTGEPGRDGGCLLTTFGTADISDTARIVTKQIVKDGVGGYNATIELDFHGVKKDIPMKLGFVKQTHIDATNPYTLGGMNAEFTFNALSDFGIVSGNIADAVTVRINTQFRKPD